MPHSDLAASPEGASSEVLDSSRVALGRISRLAVTAFGVPFAQVIQFGGGDGMTAAPVSHGMLHGQEPDLRLACASMPPAASLTVIEDAARDARLTLPSEARFFAYARIDAPDGRTVGAVCLVDDAPRTLSVLETERLGDLAALAGATLAPPAPSTSAALADAEARFMALSEAVFDALLITDEGVIVDANPQAATLLGYDDPEVLIDRSVLDLVPEEHAEAVRERINQSGCYRVVVKRGDGSTASVEVQAETFPHDGRLLRVSAFRAAAE